MNPTITDAIRVLIEGQTLDETSASALFDAVLAGHADAPQIAAILALIQQRGVTVDELTGAARSMRRVVTPVPVTPDLKAHLVDTCGTGGAPKTFNISTAAAVIAAAAGSRLDRQNRPRVVVAKHGNRSRTGRGSAEVLAELGINIDASPDTQARCIEHAGVCFSFAIRHHPAMVHAAEPRKSLAHPTVFNILGPLTNPAGAQRQLIGVYDPRFIPLVIATLQRLGATRATVAHGDDGLDEITTTASSRLATLDNGTITTSTLDPATLGIAAPSLDDLRAHSVEHAAQIVRDVLDNTPGPPRDIAALNAAAAIHTAGAADSIADALPIALDALDSGAAKHTLDELKRVSHQN